MTKAHFIVRVCGAPKRLITIREVSQGKLQMIVHIKGFFISTDVTEAVITECKYSLHVSPNSRTGAATSHNTTVYSNGAREHTYILTQAVRNGSYQPLERRSFRGLEHEPTYDVPPSHHALELGDYNPATHTLWVATWFAGPDMPEPNVRNCTVVAARFKRFAVFALACFTHEPTPDDVRYYLYRTTSPQKMTPEDVAGGVRAGPSTGCSRTLSEYVAVRDFNSIIQNDLSQIGQLVPQVLAHHIPEPLFTARPQP